MHVCVSDNDFESASTIFLLDIGTGLMFLCLFVCLFIFGFVCLFVCIFIFWLLLFLLFLFFFVAAYF